MTTNIRYQWGSVDRCYWPLCGHGGSVEVPVRYWQEGVEFREVRGYCAHHAESLAVTI